MKWLFTTLVVTLFMGASAVQAQELEGPSDLRLSEPTSLVASSSVADGLELAAPRPRRAPIFGPPRQLDPGSDSGVGSDSNLDGGIVGFLLGSILGTALGSGTGYLFSGLGEDSETGFGSSEFAAMALGGFLGMIMGAIIGPLAGVTIDASN